MNILNAVDYIPRSVREIPVSCWASCCCTSCVQWPMQCASKCWPRSLSREYLIMAIALFNIYSLGPRERPNRYLAYLMQEETTRDIFRHDVLRSIAIIIEDCRNHYTLHPIIIICSRPSNNHHLYTLYDEHFLTESYNLSKLFKVSTTNKLTI